MKKLLLILIFVFSSFTLTNAVSVTVSSQTVPDVRFAGSTAQVRIWATCGKSTFFTSDGVARVCGAVGTTNVYKVVNATIASNVLTIPSFTIDSTTDSDQPQTRYSAVIYDASGNRRIDFMLNFSVPHTKGTLLSWSQIRTYNSANSIPLNSNTYYDKEQVNSLVAAEQTLILGSSDVKNKLACYTPEYYGAVANDSVDDRAYILQAYQAATAAKGALCLQSAEYRVSSVINLVSNTAVIGIPGNGYSSGGSRIVLTASNQAIFHIGEGVLNVTFENIDLQAANGLTNTKGVDFSGSDPNSSQFFEFKNVSFRDFTYGIFIDALDVGNNWQVEQVRIQKCNFTNNQYGIKVEANNAGIQIYDSVFYLTAGGYGIHANAIGLFRVVNSFAARNYTTYCDSYSPSYPYTPVYNSNLGEAFIYLNGQHSTVYLETILAEGVKYTLVNNYQSLLSPIEVHNSILSDVRLNADTHFVSVGNQYYVNTLEAAGATNDTRIYSYGDAIDAANRHKCIGTGTGTGFVLSGGAKLVTKTVLNGFYSPLTTFFGDLNEPANSADTDFTTGKVQIGLSTTYAVQGKPIFTIGETTGGTFTNKFEFFRNQINGALSIRPSQDPPYKIFEFDGALQLKKQTTYSAPEANTAKFVLDTNNVLRVCVNGQSTCEPVGGEVNARWFGVAGDGSTDDSAAMQTAITFAAANNLRLVISPGVYMIGNIMLPPSNSHIVIQKGAELKAKLGMFDGGSIFALRDVSNVIIEGEGIINGNKQGFVDTWRVTPVIINGGSNIKIKGITIKNGAALDGSFGDGMYVLMGYNVATAPEKLTIDGVTFDSNERGGMQMSSCIDCKIINNYFINTSGDTNGWLGPSAGIDFENHPLSISVNDAVTNGTTTITSATANFTQFSVANKPFITIEIPTGSGGGHYQATITAINSATNVTVDIAPTFSLSGLAMVVNAESVNEFVGVLVQGNHFINNAGGGVIVNGRNNKPVRGLTFLNNIFRDNGNFGLSFAGQYGDGITVANNLIQGTTVIGGFCDGAAGGTGLAISSSYGVNITGNDIVDNQCHGLWLNGAVHANVVGNKINRNKSHGIFFLASSAFSSSVGAGLMTTVANNQIFNNGIQTANTYDGIHIGNGNPVTSRNMGLVLSGNWIGNDPFVKYTPTQRYAVYFHTIDAQGTTLLFNNYFGNLSGDAFSNTGSAINPILEFSPFVTDKQRNLTLGSVGTTAGSYLSGGSFVSTPYLPAQITSNQNNYPLNKQSVNIDIRSDAARDITGIEAGQNGETKWIHNYGNFPITLKYENASSNASNRFWNGSGIDVVIYTGQQVRIYYTTVWNRWVVDEPLLFFGSASLDFPSIAAAGTQDLTISVAGAATGYKCQATPDGLPEAGLVPFCSVTSANTVTIRLTNVTAGAIDPASRTWTVEVRK